MLIDLETLLGFIIGARSLNDIRYTNEIVLIAETEVKLQKTDLVEEVNEKKGKNHHLC